MRKGTRSTKDIYPDYFDVTMFQAAANDPLDQTVALPFPRLAVTAGRAWVMEVLWAELNTTWVPTAGQVTTAQWTVAWHTAQLAGITSLAGLLDGGAFAVYSNTWTGTGAEPMPGGVEEDFPKKYEYQTQDGHGVLVAVDRISVAARTSGLNPAGFRLRIYYRLTDVKLDEFIGIVQSQSQRNI